MSARGAEEKPHFSEIYSLRKKIGRGAYAAVYKCVHRTTGKSYAVKVVDKSKAGPKDIDDLMHEITVMEAVGYHPHVVQMIEYFSTERHLYLVLDLLNGGMLFDRIVQQKHYSEQNAAQLMRNLLSSLAHIHSKGIIHRDLKPENLLLRYAEDEAPSSASHLTDVCLADFGLAGYVPSTTCCGSPSYIAPEVINVGYYRTTQLPYDCKCDIWSLGVITYILLSGRMPFHGESFKVTFTKIVGNQWGFVGSIWKQLSPAATEFIKACLTPDPKLRPSAVELLKHPWVAEQQPDVHLEDSLELLRKFNAQQKIRAVVRVFCWTQSLLGRHLNTTPPFMRYLQHDDMFSTKVKHQSQTDPTKVHIVDYGEAMNNKKPGWSIQSCCTCESKMVCRHIQNVHEYLFVGKRSMDVYPLMTELTMHRVETTQDLDAEKKTSPRSEAAVALEEKLKLINHVIEAACVFSEQLAKVPRDELKPNFMLDGSRNDVFRKNGGSRSMVK